MEWGQQAEGLQAMHSVVPCSGLPSSCAVQASDPAPLARCHAAPQGHPPPGCETSARLSPAGAAPVPSPCPARLSAPRGCSGGRGPRLAACTCGKASFVRQLVDQTVSKWSSWKGGCVTKAGGRRGRRQAVSADPGPQLAACETTPKQGQSGEVRGGQAGAGERGWRPCVHSALHPCSHTGTNTHARTAPAPLTASAAAAGRPPFG